MTTQFRTALAAGALLAGALLAGCEPPPVDTVQRGYRGLGMVELQNPAAAAKLVAANAVPEATPKAEPGSPPATQIYKNVTVLNDLGVGEFTRLMVAMTAWVSPEKGCVYCHDATDFASDKLYAKVVARRMLQMTRKVNADWKDHVAGTGVTCYTCHRGKPVPDGVWHSEPAPVAVKGPMGYRGGQNTPSAAVGLTSLPYDPLTPYLGNASVVRVAATQALPEGRGASIQHTEWTYAFMVHISKALGVNCTYCHNSRSFADWDGSTPQRATAFHGIRMVRELNKDYLEPLAATFPPERLGPLGDGPKVSCATCHQGAYKPLLGESMLKDYPELAAQGAPLAVAAAPAAAPAAGAKPPAKK
jgi:photosynthetic reaction center cytochrome c subunit